MVTLANKTTIGDKYLMLEKVLDERARRLWGATEAQVLGYGGVSAVAEQTGLARSTIHRGLKELQKLQSDDFTGIAAVGCIRCPGALLRPSRSSASTSSASAPAPERSTSGFRRLTWIFM